MQISGDNTEMPEGNSIVKTLGSPIATYKMLVCSFLHNHHSNELHDYRENGAKAIHAANKNDIFVFLCVICNRDF